MPTQQRIQSFEIDVTTTIFVLLWRCRLESQDNFAFSSLFGRSIAAAEDSVRAVLSHAVITCRGLDWDRYRLLCREAVCCWDSHRKALISDEPTALLVARIAKAEGREIKLDSTEVQLCGGANSLGTEGRVMRKAARVFSRAALLGRLQLGESVLAKLLPLLDAMVAQIQDHLDF